MSDRNLAKIGVIAWREFRHTALTKAFLFGAVILPIGMMGMLLVLPLLFASQFKPLIGHGDRRRFREVGDAARHGRVSVSSRPSSGPRQQFTEQGGDHRQQCSHDQCDEDLQTTSHADRFDGCGRCEHDSSSQVLLPLEPDFLNLSLQLGGKFRQCSLVGIGAGGT